jgi:subtilisin family serine protease
VTAARTWITTCLAVLPLTVTMVAAPAQAAGQVTAGRVVVDVADGTDPATVAARYGIATDQVFLEAVNGFAATVTGRQLASLQTDTTVESVTNDMVIGRIDRDFLHGRSRKLPGAGPYVPPAQFDQYVTPEIRRIGAPLSRTADIDGRDDRRVDADIAILDGGLDPYHPDLNVAGGYDCLPGPAAQRGWYDRDGHGTLVGGFAAAIDNGIGVVGAAPGARLWGIRVADPAGFITDSALLCGLEWVARHSGRIEVANLSLAGSGNLIGPCVNRRALKHDKFGKRGPIDRIHQKICQVTAKGVTVVAAAGNSAADASSFTPAAYDEVIAVSAIVDFDGRPGGESPTPAECYPTDRDDTFAEFSNYGKPVDVAAPGVCVISTFPGGLYAITDGTSFSAPLVSGGAALIAARTPGVSPARVRSMIIAKGEPGPIPGDPDSYPEPVLNVAAF